MLSLLHHTSSLMERWNLMAVHQASNTVIITFKDRKQHPLLPYVINILVIASKITKGHGCFTA